MTDARLQFRKLSFTGPQKDAACLDFKPGLNIIHGASDTGKSFAVDALNFMLGGSKPLKDIPERVGYEKVILNLWATKEEDIRLERSTDGGDFMMKIGDQAHRELSAKHSAKNEANLSWYLLGLSNLSQKMIKKNSETKRGLSFRDIVDFVVVPESVITKEGSPLLSGEYVTATPEKSTFKLLLTGVDDASYVNVTRTKDDTVSLKLIDQLITEFKTELESQESKKDIDDQLSKLKSSIEQQNEAVDAIQEDLQEALQRRNELAETRGFALVRLEEIDGLLERFNLLDEHYSNDLLRLEAIQESGILLGFKETKDCPLCGAAPKDQNHEHSCDGDLKSVIDAASAEIMKILQLKNELGKTVKEIRNEQRQLTSRISEYDNEFTKLQDKVSQTLAPELATNKNKFSDLVKKHYEASRTKEILEKIEALEAKKMLYRKKGKSTDAIGEANALSKAVLGGFSRKIADILKAWGFPGTGAVYFDEKTFDVVVSDKPRGSYGKGLRAITHAAFSIALLEYCVEKGLPHPGFVVLDSPLLAYRAPEPGDEEIHKTDLKDKFYKYLSEMGAGVQVIVYENVSPSKNLANANIIHFTSNPKIGRYGLFPPTSE